jgi:hypothetical protein
MLKLNTTVAWRASHQDAVLLGEHILFKVLAPYGELEIAPNRPSHGAWSMSHMGQKLTWASGVSTSVFTSVTDIENRLSDVMERRCLLGPRQRTLSPTVVRSALCQ